MTAANVTFENTGLDLASPGEEQFANFDCPKHKGRRCHGLTISNRPHSGKRDPSNQNGGCAQWDWDGNREAPTFSPSVNCGGCWHGYIRAGRCVDTSGNDEPSP